MEQLRSYLSGRFPGFRVREDWNPSRDVLELRVQRPGGETLLVEISADCIESSSESELIRSLEDWGLPKSLREHLSVRMSPRGLEPLPWSQLPAKRDIVEETSEESFPASDARGFSSITPGSRP